MKRLLAVVLAIIIVFALTACGGKTDPTLSGSDDKTLSNSQQHPEQSTAPNNGGSETSGNETSNGEIEAIEWPDNEYTRQVPKPENAVITTAEDMAGVQFAFVMEMSLEDVAAYAQQLIDAGYDGKWEEQAKMFSGKSENGYRAELMYNSATQTIFTISKVQ